MVVGLGFVGGDFGSGLVRECPYWSRAPQQASQNREQGVQVLTYICNIAMVQEFCFDCEAEKAFHFRGGSERYSDVPLEEGWRTQGVPFDDIRLYGYACPAELVVERPG